MVTRGAGSILAANVVSSTSQFESGRNLAIVGIGLFIFASLFIVFPRNRPMPTEQGPALGVAFVARWGRWIALAIGIWGIVKMIRA
jgi:hypothetical protein